MRWIREQGWSSQRWSRAGEKQRNEAEVWTETPSSGVGRKGKERRRMTDRKTQDEPQWIVAQRLLSALTIPGFN